MKKTIKNILFKLDIEGNGIVNYDSGSQKFIFNSDNAEKNAKAQKGKGNKDEYIKYNQLGYKDDNISYAKKNFYGTAGEENFRWKIKISSECMKKAIFDEELIAHTSKIAHDDNLLYRYISSPLAIITGYMDATRKEDVIKKTGVLKLYDAEQTCDAISYIETFSKSGHKKKKTDKDDKSDNTFYAKENVGDIKYHAEGEIDLKELQFISCDEIYGRYCFDPDKFELYKECYELRHPDANLQLDYYQLKTSSIEIPEYGVKLNDSEIIGMVKMTLKRILAMHISRNKASAKTSELKIKLVENPLVDTRESEDNWITINSESDIDNLDFEIQDYYILANELAISNRENMEKEFVEYTKKK